MNVTLRTFEQLSSIQLEHFSLMLAQTPVPLPVPTTVDGNPLASPVNQALTSFGLGSLGPTLVNLIGAIVVFILGWILAAIVAGVVKNLLRRTNLDNRIAQSVSGTGVGINTEGLLSSIVFWTILVLALVAALDVMQLRTVSQPLNNFLDQIFAFLPKLGAAGLLAAIAWVLATLAKTVVTRVAKSFNLDRRVAPPAPGEVRDVYGNVGQATSEPPYGVSGDVRQVATATEKPFLLSETIGNALYWFVFLFFLPLILGVLDLQGPLQPVQNLLNDVLAALPRIFKAVLIGAIGWLIARVVRDIVTNLLSAAGADQVGARFGLRRTANTQSLSWLIGTIVYVLILIPTAVAALEALQIQAISAPAVAMLNQILTALPQVFTAALILVAAYAIGRFVADLVTNILAGLGFDSIFQWIGLQPPQARVVTPPTGLETPDLEGRTLTDQRDLSGLPTRSPSEIAGIVALVGIMLFAIVAAVDILRIPALTEIVRELIVVFGRILVGLAIFAVGLYLANTAYNLILSSGTNQARILAQAARIAIIVLVTSMALQQIGIATDIVNLAFGLLLGAIAVAIAIAFGWGGRNVAAAQLEEWFANFKRNK